MTDKMLVKVLIPSLLVFGFAVWALLRPGIEWIKLVTKFISVEVKKFRKLIKNDYNITKLSLVDSQGKNLTPYPLREGENTFKCVATYTDGSTAEYAPYWLCWPKSRYDCWGVFGKRRKKQVSVNCYPNHERYTELSCWVFPPKKEDSQEHIPHDSIGFTYPYYDETH